MIHVPDPGMRRTNEDVRQPMPECWRIVGVSGDRTCPELATVIHCRNCPVLTEAARTFFERSAPPGYLEGWRAILEEPAAPPATDSLSVLVFRVAGEWLALSTLVLVEVTPVRALHRLPHRGATVLAGLVNIRGQIQLCGSLHGLLGLAGGPVRGGASSGEGDASTARLLVVERGGEATGERWVLGVDEVAGVQRICRDALRPVPSTVGQAGARCSSALFDWQDKTVALVDEPRMFDALRAAVTE